MNFHTRKWVKPEDLNPHGTLFGGSLLRWVDEEAAIYALCQIGPHQVVTKHMSAIDFVAPARLNDVIELGMAATAFGRTSLTMHAEVRVKSTRRTILTIGSMVFVTVDEHGVPVPHGRTGERRADEAYEAWEAYESSLPRRPRRYADPLAS